jgi:cold shock CspA family protein
LAAIETDGLVRRAQGAIVSERTTGAVKALTTRYFGFIRLADGGQDAFFHVQQLTGGAREFHNLKIGDQMEFDLQTTERGRRAFNVTRLTP